MRQILADDKAGAIGTQHLADADPGADALVIGADRHLVPPDKGAALAESGQLVITVELVVLRQIGYGGVGQSGRLPGHLKLDAAQSLHGFVSLGRGGHIALSDCTGKGFPDGIQQGVHRNGLGDAGIGPQQGQAHRRRIAPQQPAGNAGGVHRGHYPLQVKGQVQVSGMLGGVDQQDAPFHPPDGVGDQFVAVLLGGKQQFLLKDDNLGRMVVGAAGHHLGVGDFHIVNHRAAAGAGAGIDIHRHEPALVGINLGQGLPGLHRPLAGHTEQVQLRGLRHQLPPQGPGLRKDRATAAFRYSTLPAAAKQLGKSRAIRNRRWPEPAKPGNNPGAGALYITALARFPGSG